jgi:hypothetical protein
MSGSAADQGLAARRPAASLHRTYANRPQRPDPDAEIDASAGQTDRYAGVVDVVPDGPFFSRSFNFAQSTNLMPTASDVTDGEAEALRRQTLRPANQNVGFLATEAQAGNRVDPRAGPMRLDASRHVQLYVDPLTAPPTGMQPAEALEQRVLRVGHVEQVAAASFTAIVSGPQPGAATMRATFPVEAVADRQRDLLRAGTALIWIVGYRREGDRPVGISLVTLLRRPSAWQPEQVRLSEARSRARPQPVLRGPGNGT